MCARFILLYNCSRDYIDLFISFHLFLLSRDQRIHIRTFKTIEGEGDRQRKLKRFKVLTYFTIIILQTTYYKFIHICPQRSRGNHVAHFHPIQSCMPGTARVRSRENQVLL